MREPKLDITQHPEYKEKVERVAEKIILAISQNPVALASYIKNLGQGDLDTINVLNQYIEKELKLPENFGDRVRVLTPRTDVAEIIKKRLLDNNEPEPEPQERDDGQGRGVVISGEGRVEDVATGPENTDQVKGLQAEARKLLQDVNGYLIDNKDKDSGGRHGLRLQNIQKFSEEVVRVSNPKNEKEIQQLQDAIATLRSSFFNLQRAIGESAMKNEPQPPSVGSVETGPGTSSDEFDYLNINSKSGTPGSGGMRVDYRDLFAEKRKGNLDLGTLGERGDVSSIEGDSEKEKKVKSILEKLAALEVRIIREQREYNALGVLNLFKKDKLAASIRRAQELMRIYINDLKKLDTGHLLIKKYERILKNHMHNNVGGERSRGLPAEKTTVDKPKTEGEIGSLEKAKETLEKLENKRIDKYIVYKVRQLFAGESPGSLTQAIDVLIKKDKEGQKIGDVLSRIVSGAVDDAKFKIKDTSGNLVLDVSDTEDFGSVDEMMVEGEMLKGNLKIKNRDDLIKALIFHKIDRELKRREDKTDEKGIKNIGHKAARMLSGATLGVSDLAAKKIGIMERQKGREAREVEQIRKALQKRNRQTIRQHGYLSGVWNKYITNADTLTSKEKGRVAGVSGAAFSIMFGALSVLTPVQLAAWGISKTAFSSFGTAGILASGIGSYSVAQSAIRGIMTALPKFNKERYKGVEFPTALWNTTKTVTCQVGISALFGLPASAMGHVVGVALGTLFEHFIISTDTGISQSKLVSVKENIKNLVATKNGVDELFAIFAQSNGNPQFVLAGFLNFLPRQVNVLPLQDVVVDSKKGLWEKFLENIKKPSQSTPQSPTELTPSQPPEAAPKDTPLVLPNALERGGAGKVGIGQIVKSVDIIDPRKISVVEIIKLAEKIVPEQRNVFFLELAKRVNTGNIIGWGTEIKNVHPEILKNLSPEVKFQILPAQIKELSVMQLRLIGVTNLNPNSIANIIFKDNNDLIKVKYLVEVLSSIDNIEKYGRSAPGWFGRKNPSTIERIILNTRGQNGEVVQIDDLVRVLDFFGLEKKANGDIVKTVSTSKAPDAPTTRVETAEQELNRVKDKNFKFSDLGISRNDLTTLFDEKGNLKFKHRQTLDYVVSVMFAQNVTKEQISQQISKLSDAQIRTIFLETNGKDFYPKRFGIVKVNVPIFREALEERLGKNKIVVLSRDTIPPKVESVPETTSVPPAEPPKVATPQIEPRQPGSTRLVVEEEKRIIGTEDKTSQVGKKIVNLDNEFRGQRNFNPGRVAFENGFMSVSRVPTSQAVWNAYLQQNSDFSKLSPVQQDEVLRRIDAKILSESMINRRLRFQFADTLGVKSMQLYDRNITYNKFSLEKMKNLFTTAGLGQEEINRIIALARK